MKTDTDTDTVKFLARKSSQPRPLTAKEIAAVDKAILKDEPDGWDHAPSGMWARATLFPSCAFDGPVRKSYPDIAVILWCNGTVMTVSLAKGKATIMHSQLS